MRLLVPRITHHWNLTITFHNNNGLSAGNTYYNCYFVVPFGKTVKFKAEADPKESRINNAWGKLQDISLAPTRENPVVKYLIKIKRHV